MRAALFIIAMLLLCGCKTKPELKNSESGKTIKQKMQAAKAGHDAATGFIATDSVGRAEFGEPGKPVTCLLSWDHTNDTAWSFVIERAENPAGPFAAIRYVEPSEGSQLWNNVWFYIITLTEQPAVKAFYRVGAL